MKHDVYSFAWLGHLKQGPNAQTSLSSIESDSSPNFQVLLTAYMVCNENVLFSICFFIFPSYLFTFPSYYIAYAPFQGGDVGSEIFEFGKSPELEIFPGPADIFPNVTSSWGR